MAQSKNARLDESLGMRRGKESTKMQSYKDRRDESRGMSKNGTFNIPDGQMSFEVRNIPTNTEKYDLGRIKPYTCGSKGYPAEAWNYKY